MHDALWILFWVNTVVTFIVHVVGSTENKRQLHRYMLDDKEDLELWQWLYLVLALPWILLFEIIVPIGKGLGSLLSWKPAQKRNQRIR